MQVEYSSRSKFILEVRLKLYQTMRVVPSSSKFSIVLSTVLGLQLIACTNVSALKLKLKMIDFSRMIFDAAVQVQKELEEDEPVKRVDDDDDEALLEGVVNMNARTTEEAEAENEVSKLEKEKPSQEVLELAALLFFNRDYNYPGFATVKKRWLYVQVMNMSQTSNEERKTEILKMKQYAELKKQDKSSIDPQKYSNDASNTTSTSVEAEQNMPGLASPGSSRGTVSPPPESPTILDLCKSGDWAILSNELQNLSKTDIAKGASEVDEDWQRTPLHYAVLAKAPLKVVQALVASYPRAVVMRDDTDKTPLSIAKATQDGCATVVEALKDAVQFLSEADRFEIELENRFEAVEHEVELSTLPEELQSLTEESNCVTLYESDSAAMDECLQEELEDLALKSDADAERKDAEREDAYFSAEAVRTAEGEVKAARQRVDHLIFNQQREQFRKITAARQRYAENARPDAARQGHAESARLLRDIPTVKDSSRLLPHPNVMIERMRRSKIFVTTNYRKARGPRTHYK